MLPKVRKYLDLAIGFFCGLLVSGLALLLIVSIKGQQGFSLSPAPSPAPVTVEIRGGVNNPGIYQVPAGSRVLDVIQLAGGFAPGASSDQVNLARKLIDGEKIIISNQGIINVDGNSSFININRANEFELQRLPGIGPKIARDIVAYRTEHGPFELPEDLMNVPGIGEVTFNRIKSIITLVDP